MDYARERLNWNAWGWRNQRYDFGGHENEFWSFVQQTLHLTDLKDYPAAALNQISIPPSRLSADLQSKLSAYFSDGFVLDDYERIFHSKGRSYLDLVALRKGQLPVLPDAIVYPQNSHQIVWLLDFARQHQLALIPFGGGSSVVGGIQPARKEGLTAIITLDLSHMNRLLHLDPLNLSARFECGIYGPQLEKILNRQGFTMGHTPQSFEFSTLGGWIAARGAGERSNHFGKMEAILISARVLTPRGEWATLNLPASAAGPDLNHLIAGSEGLLGVIVEATVKIQPLPPSERHAGFLFKHFSQAIDAIRRLSQSGQIPAMLRLSDENETHYILKSQSTGSSKSWLANLSKAFLKKQGYTRHPSLLLIGFEGSSSEVMAQMAQAHQMCLGAGGFPLGGKAGTRWSQSRYQTPYLRDALLDRGIGIETLETAAPWTKLASLYAAVKHALQNSMAESLADSPLSHAQCFVMTHVSHCYPNGASLYFTFVFPQDIGNEVAQYQIIKNAACEAILAHGGTISHHHGVGADHARWLHQEKGELGQGTLQAVKDYLDPEGIMNPGKWLK